MDKPCLEGVDLKIARAKSHLTDLEEAIKWALDPNRYEFRREIDPETQKHIIWIDPIPFIVPEWSIIIGEILFHLRSALDHLAYQLVILDRGSPADHTQFPIRDSPFDKNGKSLPLRDLMPQVKNSKILTAVHECQPYQGPDREPLWLLKVLNNIDKHRLLLVVMCILDTGKMWWDSPDTPAPTVSIITGPFKKGSPVGCIDFHGVQAPEDFDPHPALAVAFDEPETATIKEMPFDSILSEMCRHVETDILDAHFRPLFES